MILNFNRLNLEVLVWARMLLIDLSRFPKCIVWVELYFIRLVKAVSNLRLFLKGIELSKDEYEKTLQYLKWGKVILENPRNPEGSRNSEMSLDEINKYDFIMIWLKSLDMSRNTLVWRQRVPKSLFLSQDTPDFSKEYRSSQNLCCEAKYIWQFIPRNVLGICIEFLMPIGINYSEC